MLKPRVLGLDYGDKTIGVAVSDPLGLTAQGHSVIRRENAVDLKKSIEEIVRIVAEYEISAIVLGYPKHMNNDAGTRCALTEVFAKKLKKALGLPIILQDERLTSVMAERALDETNTHRQKRNAVIDKIAAVFILQEYLNIQNMKEMEQNDRPV